MIIMTTLMTVILIIQVGDTLEADKYNSIFMGMMDQVTPEITSS